MDRIVANPFPDVDKLLSFDKIFRSIGLLRGLSAGHCFQELLEDMSERDALTLESVHSLVR